MSDINHPTLKDAATRRLFMHSDELREEGKVVIEKGDQDSDKAKALIKRSEDACRRACEVARRAPEPKTQLYVESLPEWLQPILDAQA